MTPVICKVKHDPENGTFGDCLRACIATIMDLPSDDVPHFFHDNCDGETGNARLSNWLQDTEYAPMWVHYPAEIEYSSLMELLAKANADFHYILYGATIEGDHVVVCKGGEVVHNPSWYRMIMDKPGSHGFWSILVLVRK